MVMYVRAEGVRLRNVRTYVATSTMLVCHIRTQQTRSTEDEDVNWVRTNLRTGKNHSAER